MVKKMAKQAEPEVVEVEEEPAVEQKPAAKKLVKKAVEAPKAKEKEAKAPKEVDPNQVTLKELCEEHKLNATTARVKLRRKYGAQGVRYTWEKGSKELEAVVTLLTMKEEKAEKDEPKAAAKKTAPKKKTKAAPAEEEVEEEEETEDAEIE
jgi:hypothetical protein